MGKFYDAMQKVSRTDTKEPSSAEVAKPRLPDLDEELLQPEESGTAGLPPEAPIAGRVLSESAAPSGHGRKSKVDAAKLDHGQPRSDEPVLRVVESEIEADRQTIEKHPLLSSMRRLRTDVFRRPIEAAYERIIQRLFAYRRSPRESVILVTSAVSGEGTSTVARNIALALAQHRAERVLLIDANLRSPTQHLAFRMDMPEGLGDVLLGPMTLTSAVQDDVAPGLSLLAAGQAKESPAQLLTVASLHSVILALLSLFDWIIIDSPPVTSYPDVATIAAAAGGAILVVEAEKTRQEVVEEAKRVLDVSGIDLLGAVLNRRRFHIPSFIYRRL